MTREGYLRNLIIEKYKSIRKFSENIDVPASTITSMLSNGVGGTAIDTVIKVCKALDIKTDDLELIEQSNPSDNITRATYYTKGKDEENGEGLGEAQLVYTYRKLSTEGKTSVRNFADYTLSQEQKTYTTKEYFMPEHLKAAEPQSPYLAAAHNDAELTEEELALMQQDLDEL